MTVKKQIPNYSIDTVRGEGQAPEDLMAAPFGEYLRTHLNSLCRDLLGISAGEVIRERIVLEAKRLLVNGGLSITEIAYRLNFQDNSYFTKFFKKYAGATPEDFRRVHHVVIKNQ